VYWGGLIAGTAVTHLAVAPFGWHPLVRLACAIAVGVAVGYVCEKVYDRARRRRPPD
jgi:hypothetical protein